MRVFRGASAGARGPLAALGGSWRLSGRPKSRGGLGDHKYNNEHECWEKTVTEGMAMQADHKQYSYRYITKTSRHSSTFKFNYFHSGAMLELFLAMLDHSPVVPLIILRSRQ